MGLVSEVKGPRAVAGPNGNLATQLIHTLLDNGVMSHSSFNVKPFEIME